MRNNREIKLPGLNANIKMLRNRPFHPTLISLKPVTNTICICARMKKRGKIMHMLTRKSEEAKWYCSYPAPYIELGTGQTKHGPHCWTMCQFHRWLTPILLCTQQKCSVLSESKEIVPVANSTSVIIHNTIIALTLLYIRIQWYYFPLYQLLRSSD